MRLGLGFFLGPKPPQKLEAAQERRNRTLATNRGRHGHVVGAMCASGTKKSFLFFSFFAQPPCPPSGLEMIGLIFVVLSQEIILVCCTSQ